MKLISMKVQIDNKPFHKTWTEIYNLLGHTANEINEKTWDEVYTNSDLVENTKKVLSKWRKTQL